MKKDKNLLFVLYFFKTLPEFADYADKYFF